MRKQYSWCAKVNSQQGGTPLITIGCPACHKLSEVGQDKLGKTIPCPHCGGPVAVTLDNLFSDGPTADTPSESTVPLGRGAGNYTGPTVAKRGPEASPARVQASRRGVNTAALLQLTIAVVLTVVFYVLMIVAQKTFGNSWTYPEKFLERGWTQYACVLLTFWSLCILYSKWRAVLRRERCVKETVIPAGARLSGDLGYKEVMNAVRSAAQRHDDHSLSDRVQEVVGVYRSSRSAQSAAEALTAESDAAYGNLEASYTLVRVFLWTIPILGFIGTVMGIGDAVGGFAHFLSAGTQEIDQIKNALTEVTKNLAVAFDTTLVALLLSVVVMIFVSYVENREKSLLQAFDDFCRERLLPLMTVGAPAGPGGGGGDYRHLEEVLRKIFGETPQSAAAAWREAANEWTDQFFHRLSEASRDWDTGTVPLLKIDGLSATLRELADGVHRMDPALRRLAEKPLDVKVQFVARTPETVVE